MTGSNNFVFQAIFGFILIAANICSAQENIRFERITVSEGLSQSDVKSMVQDKFGFLWIGTRDGLNKYDGIEFTRFSREINDSTSLYFNQILDLQMDSSGNIWIGSTGGISIYDYRKNNFQNFSPVNIDLQGVDINHILLTGRYTALLSTSKGLVSFDLKQRRFFIDPDLISFKDRRVYCVYQSPESGLWVGTDNGVYIRASAYSGWVRLLEGKSVQHICFDPNGKVYLSTTSGLFRYDLKNRRAEQIVTTAVTDVLRTKDGDLWVASNKVIVLDKNDVIKYVLGHDKFNNYSLSEDRARVLFQTHDEVIWVGTFGYGLNKFNPDVAKFSYLSEQTSIPLSGNYVSTIFTDDDTTLLVGTSRGMDAIDLRTGSAKHFGSRNEDLFQILKIFVDRKKNIWVSTSSGLMLFSGNKLIPKNISLRSVYDFKEWDDTNLILATRVNGIYLFDRITGNTSLFISADDLKEEASCMLIEGDHLWVGCKDGLKLFNREGKLTKHFKASNQEPRSLHSSFIKCLYRDSRERLWIGTWGGGLSLLIPKDSSLTTYTARDGLPNNVIYGILEDRSGNLWLSTNVGLSVFNPEDRIFRNLDFFEGLQSNEFNTGAYFESTGGKMYFGGVNGLSFFYPEEILVHHPVPSILKTYVTINNKALTFQDSDSLMNVMMISNLTLSWRENDVGVKFTAIDFKNARQQIFQYSIEGKTWYDIGNRRSLELLDLPSGFHEIKARIRKLGTGWSQDVVLLAIDIVPPVWQRLWFRIMSVLAFLAMTFAFYRYKVTRLKQINATLNRLVSERTTEIQAMNEEIISQNDQLQELVKELEAFSYSISHDLRAPLRSLIGYSKMLEEDFNEKLDEEGGRMLNIIQHNAARMNNMIDDLLEFSKLGKTELQKYKIDIEKLLKNILAEINISTQHKAEIKLNPLPPIFADSELISQVWINLISNAVKYSAKRETPVVEVGSYSDGNEVVFYVRDNGAGFDMKYVDKLFRVFHRLHRMDEFEGTGVGLALVHRIVAKHGGRVWAEGEVNQGATFYFSLPK